MNLKGVLQMKATERRLVRGPVDKLTFIKLNTRRPLSPLPLFFLGGGLEDISTWVLYCKFEGK